MTDTALTDAVTVYYVDPMISVGTPLLIVVVISNNPKRWMGEMYLLLQGEDCRILHKRLHADSTTWPDCDLVLDESFIHQDLVQHARPLFSLFWEDSGRVKRYGLPPGSLNIREAGLTGLVSFWTQTPCGEKLKLIQQHTSSEALRAVLKLATSFPKFQYEPAIPMSGTSGSDT